MSEGGEQKLLTIPPISTKRTNVCLFTGYMFYRNSLIKWMWGNVECCFSY